MMSTKTQVHLQTMWGQPPSAVPAEGRERTDDLSPLPTKPAANGAAL